MATWNRLGAVLGPLGASWEPSGAILGYLQPSWEVIWGSPGSSWSHLGPCWTLQRLANRPLQVQGRGMGKGSRHPPG
eukprot:8479002-Pyramimonas_sp.AAC.1